MKLDLSIREKLVVFYVVLGFTAVSVLGIYSFLSAKDAILDRTFQQLTSVREVKKARLSQFFNDRFKEIELLSTSEDIKNILDHKMLLDTNIYRFLSQGNYYSSFQILSANNEVVFLHSFNQKQDSCIITTEYCSTISKTKKSELFDYKLCANEYCLLLGSPILNKNKIVAYVFLTIPVSAINEIMLEKNSFRGLGNSGESYLVGNDFLMRSSSRFHEESILKTIVKTDAATNVFQQNFGTKIINDYRGIEVLSSYTSISISNINWAILAEIDFKEVMHPVFAIRNDIILMSGLIILVLSFFAFLISRKITTPLLKLRAVALEIAKGHYGKTLQVESNDEVGELTESFNHMSVQIEVQTKELVESEKRLHHFYQATTDGIILHNRGKIILVNQAIINQTFFKNDEILLLDLSKLILFKDSERIKKHPEKNYIFETECIRKDGTRFPVEVIENPIEYEGNVIGAIVIRDISERTEIQRKLQEERNMRLTSFIDGQEDERKRISREIHDGLGQSLVGIKMRLDMLELQDTEKNKSTLDIVKTFVHQTIQDVRRVSNNLMPSALRDIGLKLAIQKLCDETENNTGIIINLDAESVTVIDDDRVKSYLYRITQEAIHNAVKHSKATEMSIMLIQEPKKVRLIIEDNGVGFDEENLQSRGNGLYYMKERVAILQGKITISSSPGKGAYIDVRIPLEKK